MPFEPRVVVVTGATGFTGGFVVRAIARRYPGVRLRCLVRPSSDRAPLDAIGAACVVGDLRDETSLRKAFAGAETLINVASLGQDWIDSLFESIRHSAFRRGIFIGTTAMLTTLPVQSRPQRERAEALVRSSGLEWTVLRPTMIYGTPRDRNVSRLIRLVLRCPVIPVVAARAWQQPVHVEDVADAVTAVLSAEQTIGRAYNLAGREPLTLLDLVRETIAATGRTRIVVPLPVGPVRAAVRLYNAVARRPWLTVEQVGRLQEDKHFDCSDARNSFGFAPRSFRDGVRAEVQLIQQERRA